MSRVWCISLFSFKVLNDLNRKLTISFTQWELKKVKTLPIKSMSKRPSQYLPDGPWKYVSPFGGGTCSPFGFELPKLKIAGKSHTTAAAKHAGNRQSSNAAAAATAIWRPEDSSFKRPSICSVCMSTRYVSERKSSYIRPVTEPGVQLHSLFFLVKFSVFQLKSSST